MSVPASSASADGVRTDVAGVAPVELDRLRDLLLGPEIARLDGIAQHLARYRPSAEEMAPALAAALDLSQRAQPSALTQATWPLVAAGLQRSLEDSPQRVVDILFPIIGPLIRKSIAESLKDFAESLNLVLEQSFSPRYLRWRFEAWRSGVPFAEVVLRNTLLYSVEQVFLIQRESGLLIAHAARARAQGADSDAVSAMLNAIGDFVRDSFAGAQDGELSEVQVGGFEVQVQHGPVAMLALAVRGVPRLEIKHRAREALERLHAKHGAELRQFAGDGGVSPGIQPELDALLAQEQRAASKKTSLFRPGSLLLLLLAGGTLVSSCAWLYQRWQQSDFLRLLQAQPGIVLAARSGRDVVVLRDPLAAPISSFGDQHGLVIAERAWLSLDPPLVLARARRILELPDTVNASLNAGTLTLSGDFNAELPDGFVRLARSVAGVESVDLGDLHSNDPAQAFRSAKAEMAALKIQFNEGVEMAESALAQIDRAVRILSGLRGARFEAARLEITGHTDGTGLESSNRALGMDRAQAVAAALGARGLGPARIRLKYSLNEPASASDLSERRVTLRLLPAALVP